MVWILGVAAFYLGSDAADKLNRANPAPGAWFEAAVAMVLLVSAVVIYVVRRDE